MSIDFDTFMCTQIKNSKLHKNNAVYLFILIYIYVYLYVCVYIYVHKKRQYPTIAEYRPVLWSARKVSTRLYLRYPTQAARDVCGQ